MDATEGMQASIALARLAESVTLTEYEAGVYPSSGVRRFEQIVRFATVDCSKAGWLVKQRGIWSLTEAGRAAYRSIKDPAAFYKEAVRLYREWDASRGKPTTPVDESSDVIVENGGTIEKSAQITFEQAEEQAQNEIRTYLSSINPYELQQLVADLLKAMGYYPSWVSPPGPDGGLDIVAHPDPLGTRPPRIKVQVKRNAQAVDESGLRAFLALVNEDDAGLFVAIGGFTKAARDAARMQERRKITLIDLDRLLELWIEHYAKLDDLARERLPLTPIYFLTPR
ncbi:restriction system protein [Rhodopseudomonas thermotolerans]|uniref:Restriction system protein n=3 Tax=Nitrobacteraceae TaxID=41294 RepID=A0A336JLR0_9BRAD|nr:restriction system protein [Rhodopseudomonas pentothenatexigens]REG07537.1 restriction system protein [Rhodopseudomonas thermotolerans]SSW89436.1 restriction system protein [Rhodopseudomonas pentothenatexigens]